MTNSAAAAMIAAVLFLIPPTAHQSTPQTGNDNLYSVALLATLEERAQAYSSLGGEDYFNVVVEENERITKSLPEQLGQFRLTILNWEGMRARFKKVGKFPFLRIQPIINKGNRIQVDITDFWFSYRRGTFLIRRPNTLYELEGGTIIRFRYDSVTDGFVVEKAELWGI